MATIPAGSTTPKMFCGECGGSYRVEDLARFGNAFVCVNCQPGYAHRIQGGVQVTNSSSAQVRYAGFWIRALALFIDGLIISVLTAPVFLVLSFSSGGFEKIDPHNLPLGMLGLGYVFMLGLNLAYYVWFVTEKGGTPGKLALGLRVITTDGHNLTFSRSTARYFGVMLSAVTLYIGFIIAAFDSQKKALHDHICGTLVIRK